MRWMNAGVVIAAGLMYWGDSRLGRVEMSRVNGSSRRVIYENIGDRYYNFALGPRYLYITDWTER